MKQVQRCCRNFNYRWWIKNKKHLYIKKTNWERISAKRLPFFLIFSNVHFLLVWGGVSGCCVETPSHGWGLAPGSGRASAPADVWVEVNLTEYTSLVPTSFLQDTISNIQIWTISYQKPFAIRFQNIYNYCSSSKNRWHTDRFCDKSSCHVSRGLPLRDKNPRDMLDV